MPLTTYPTSDPAPLAELLTAAGVPEAYVAPAASALGDQAAGVLRSDPWQLLLVPGVGLPQADHFARQLLGDQADPADPRRGAALVTHLMLRAARDGDTSVPVPKMVAELTARKVPEPVRAVMAALDEARVIAFSIEPDEPDDFDDDLPEPEEFLALARYAMAEEAVSEGIMRLAATAEPLPGADLEEGESAVAMALRHGVSVITGPGGEAAVRALCAAVDGLRVAVVTGTDRSAADLTAFVVAAAGPAEDDADTSGNGDSARDSNGGGVAVLSLHRLLEAHEAPGGIAFARGEQWPLDAELVVVMEAQALDTELAAALVEACADGTHLVLAGDPAVLPPASAGQVFADVAASGTVPVTQAPGTGPSGPIGVLTGAVRRGELPQVDAPDREVVVVPAADAREAVHRAVQLIADSIPRALGVPAGEIQVVTPAHRGDAGAIAINAAVKARLNPGPGAYGGFDVGDRIVVAAALPAAPAGETGTVTGAGDRGLEVTFTTGRSEVPAALLSRLRHGWAITVQMSQGTRWPAVVAVLPAEAGPLLSRPLVLTATSRARRHLSVVHAAGPLLARAVREVDLPPRQTRLTGLLQGQ
jgi:exodeoxyribonuclease V alpha subunit